MANTQSHLSPYEKLLAKARNQASPLNGQFELTYRCNHRCDFCYNAPLKQKELDTAQAMEVIGKVADFGVLFLTLTTHPDNLTKNAGLLRKISAVYSDAMRIIHENPAQGKAIMAKEFSNLTKEANEQVYESMLSVWTKDGRMDEGQARRTMAYMGGLGGLKVSKDFDPKRYFSNAMLP